MRNGVKAASFVLRFLSVPGFPDPVHVQGVRVTTVLPRYLHEWLRTRSDAQAVSQSSYLRTLLARDRSELRDQSETA